MIEASRWNIFRISGAERSILHSKTYTMAGYSLIAAIQIIVYYVKEYDTIARCVVSCCAHTRVLHPLYMARGYTQPSHLGTPPKPYCLFEIDFLHDLITARNCPQKQAPTKIYKVRAFALKTSRCTKVCMNKSTKTSGPNVSTAVTRSPTHPPTLSPYVVVSLTSKHRNIIQNHKCSGFSPTNPLCLPGAPPP